MRQLKDLKLLEIKMVLKVFIVVIETKSVTISGSEYLNLNERELAPTPAPSLLIDDKMMIGY